uniref:Uncharacterized protein n=1 Tax=Caenorhabditis japonica TaxID=281687 RepID=A0A8R1I2W5_CAEJA
MNLFTFFAYVFPIFCSFASLFSISSALSLPETRLACKEQEIVYIPDASDYYEEAIELSFNSGHSFNHIPITRIVEEECGFKDKENDMFSRGSRKKRSVVTKGVRHLAKLLRHLYKNGQKVFSANLRKQFSKILRKLALARKQVATAAAVGQFWYTVWQNPEEIRREAKDETHLEEMLENAFRGTLQMLLSSNQLTEFLLHKPNVMEKIKRRIAIGNSNLLSQVEVMNVECHPTYRDSQVVIFMKLKIPKIRKVTAVKCDDIGTVIGGSYQHYVLPYATFQREKCGQNVQVDISRCFMEGFLFCPPTTITSAKCKENSLENCEMSVEPHPRNFFRELAQGFAIFGDFQQIIIKKNEQVSEIHLKPRLLYHLTLQNEEIAIIGDREFTQTTGLNSTVIRKM